MSSAFVERLHMTLIILEAPLRWIPREYPHMSYISRN